MTKIPFLIPDMPSSEELLPWLKQIDNNHWYTNFGPLNQLFSDTLLTHFPSATQQYITTVANATLGLELTLQALHLPLQAKVLIPAFTFVATATAIVRAGYTPVIADIDEHNWLLTPEIAKEALQHHQDIAAVMPVASLGCPQNTAQWDIFTEETGIPVIIDAAGAFGNQKAGRKTTLVFSLHATKSLGAGEGGFIISPDAALINQVRISSNFGMGSDRLIEESGTNGKLSEYHAAVGLAALARWPERKILREGLLKNYRAALTQALPHLGFQRSHEDFVHTLFVTRLPHDIALNQVTDALAQSGIASWRWYYPPIHQHPAFSHFPQAGSLERINLIAPSLLGLPFHCRLTPTDIQYITQHLQIALEEA